MSEAKLKAPKAVMDELDELRQVDYDTLEALLVDIYDSSVCTDWIMTESPSAVKVEQAVIDYVISNKPTIELERERHYVIYCDSVVIGLAVFYLSGGRIPVDFIESTDYEEDLNTIQYEEGWTKKDAEQLNKTINGKLVEVK